MGVFIGIIIVLGSILVWFHIPYSPVKRCFAKDVENLKASNKLQEEGQVFRSEEFSKLPIVIQRYIEHCRYIGTPKMSYLKMKYHDVDFMQGKDGPALKIDYTQYDFVSEPCRMALISSSMFGVPFEGYDYYQNGVGGMKGVIAKGITLFHQTGEEMDKASYPIRAVEGMETAWVLIDCYSVIVSIFTKEEREHFALEKIYMDVPVKKIEE